MATDNLKPAGSPASGAYASSMTSSKRAAPAAIALLAALSLAACGGGGSSPAPATNVSSNPATPPAQGATPAPVNGAAPINAPAAGGAPAPGPTPGPDATPVPEITPAPAPQAGNGTTAPPDRSAASSALTGVPLGQASTGAPPVAATQGSVPSTTAASCSFDQSRFGCGKSVVAMHLASIAPSKLGYFGAFNSKTGQRIGSEPLPAMDFAQSGGRIDSSLAQRLPQRIQLAYRSDWTIGAASLNNIAMQAQKNTPLKGDLPLGQNFAVWAGANAGRTEASSMLVGLLPLTSPQSKYAACTVGANGTQATVYVRWTCYAFGAPNANGFETPVAIVVLQEGADVLYGWTGALTAPAGAQGFAATKSLDGTSEEAEEIAAAVVAWAGTLRNRELQDPRD